MVKSPLKHLRNHWINDHGVWYTASRTREPIIDCLNDDPKEKKNNAVFPVTLLKILWSVGHFFTRYSYGCQDHLNKLSISLRKKAQYEIW